MDFLLSPFRTPLPPPSIKFYLSPLPSLHYKNHVLNLYKDGHLYGAIIAEVGYDEKFLKVLLTGCAFWNQLSKGMSIFILFFKRVRR